MAYWERLGTDGWQRFDRDDNARLEEHFARGKKAIRVWTGMVYVREMLYVQNTGSVAAIVRRVLVLESSSDPSFIAAWTICFPGRAVTDKGLSRYLEDAYVAGYDTIVIHEYNQGPLVISFKHMCAVSMSRAHADEGIYSIKRTPASEAAPGFSDPPREAAMPSVFQEMGIATRAVVDPEITECPICLCPLDESTAECVQLNKCNKHAFHAACIARVVAKRLLYCPVCRECYGRGDQPLTGTKVVRRVQRTTSEDITHTQFLFLPAHADNKIIRGAVFEMYTSTTAMGLCAQRMVDAAFDHGILFTPKMGPGLLYWISPAIDIDYFSDDSVSEQCMHGLVEDLTDLGLKRI